MQAVTLDPTDVWAVHAAAHVYEMQSRTDEGRRLLADMEEHWESAALLSCHMYWHWNLFALEDGEYRGAMSRYDGKIATVSLDSTGRGGGRQRRVCSKTQHFRNFPGCAALPCTPGVFFTAARQYLQTFRLTPSLSRRAPAQR